MAHEKLVLDGSALTIGQVESVARGGVPVTVGTQARASIESARRVVDRLAAARAPTYGLNTGLGSLSQVRIEPAVVREVQRNQIRSHAAGVGEALPAESVRAMLVVLAASLCRGHSGVRPMLIQHICDLLNNDITPVVPSRGSVGASGDLAPLAHAGLVLIGEGEALAGGRRVDGATALREAGLEPVTLEAKEALALMNGTHLMTAVAALALADLDRVLDAAIRSAAMAIDACRGTDAFLDDRLHAVRGQPGQRDVARRLREQLRGSTILEDHLEDDPRVQDPYCLRATPQVLGAVVDGLNFVRGVIERELGSVTDNPLVFPAGGTNGDDGDIVSGGNFHGMPVALALDCLAISLCHLAGIAERRIYWLLKATDGENPVHVHLSPQPGIHSGLMIVQYTAAACCNEMQTLATPASVMNIPTSAGIEDYNSMGATAAHQARAAVALAHSVIACELLVMSEAMEYQRPLHSGAAVERTHEVIRTVVPRLTADRPPAPDIGAIEQLIREGAMRLDTAG